MTTYCRAPQQDYNWSPCSLAGLQHPPAFLPSSIPPSFVMKLHSCGLWCNNVKKQSFLCYSVSYQGLIWNIALCCVYGPGSAHSPVHGRHAAMTVRLSTSKSKKLSESQASAPIGAFLHMFSNCVACPPHLPPSAEERGAGGGGQREFMTKVLKAIPPTP